jgi:hypothetical protein
MVQVEKPFVNIKIKGEKQPIKNPILSPKSSKY